MRTWKKEFYPVHANRACGSEVQAITHSLQKWRGLTGLNLRNHNVRARSAYVCGARDRQIFELDSSTCALCWLVQMQCSLCPLGRHLGKSCDSQDQPYLVWQMTRDASPMIEALEATLAEVIQQENDRRVHE